MAATARRGRGCRGCWGCHRAASALVYRGKKPYCTLLSESFAAMLSLSKRQYGFFPRYTRALAAGEVALAVHSPHPFHWTGNVVPSNGTVVRHRDVCAALNAEVNSSRLVLQMRTGAAHHVPTSRRDCYAAAGDDGKLAREEEPVVGNLYAVILQQQEMDARWAKLVRIKKLGDLVKLKKQAEAFGIDFEEFQRVTGEGVEGAEPPS